MLKINRDWALGGGLFIGLGARFFLLTLHALYFVGSIFLGIGVGLLVGSMGTKQEDALDS